MGLSSVTLAASFRRARRRQECACRAGWRLAIGSRGLRRGRTMERPWCARAPERRSDESPASGGHGQHCHRGSV